VSRLPFRCGTAIISPTVIRRRSLRHSGPRCDAVFVTGRRTITPVTGGAIEAGMAADLMLLDYRRMSGDVLDGAVSELDLVLTRGRKDYLLSLIVAGRTIVEKGTICSVDLAALESELRKQAQAAWPPALLAAKLRRRYQTALAEFYRCGCHQRPDPREL
jgi:hypothetical protein